jgi:anti-sigma factor RsiW
MEREILRRALAPDARCLSIEQLGCHADGTLGAEDETAAAAHISGCLNCQAELALLRAVMSDGIRAGEADIVRDGVARLEPRVPGISGAPREEAPVRRGWLRLGTVLPAAAMAAVLIAVGGRYYGVSRRAPELPTSVTTANEVTRSAAVAVKAPVGDVVEAPQRFEWLAVARAVRYRVRVMEVDRHEIWSVATPAAAVDLPPSVRASIGPGRTLLWEVTAYDASGASIAESGPQSFRVVPR